MWAAKHRADIRNAGTDSDITCVVYGDGGDTGLQKLDNSKNNMERGQVRDNCNWLALAHLLNCSR